MTELMLRLLKDGKIVGYEWHRLAAKDATIITVWYSLDMRLWFYSGDCDIHHDSFELGVKVFASDFSESRWIFGGDIVQCGECEPWIVSVSPGTLGNLEHAKVIGNIHEQEG